MCHKYSIFYFFQNIPKFDKKKLIPNDKKLSIQGFIAFSKKCYVLVISHLGKCVGDLFSYKWYNCYVIWKHPSLSELTPIIFNMELTHLGSEIFIQIRVMPIFRQSSTFSDGSENNRLMRCACMCLGNSVQILSQAFGYRCSSFNRYAFNFQKELEASGLK